MRTRAVIAGSLLALCAASPVPVTAGDQHGAHANVEFTGVIVNQWVPSEEASASTKSVPGYTIVGDCGFGAALTPNNRFQIAFGGTAEAAGLQAVVLTYVRCSVFDEQAQSDSSEFANAGPVSQTAKTTTPWLVSPITLCVEGFAVFGPEPITTASLARQCTTFIA